MRLSFWPAVPSLTAALNGSCGIETWRSILIVSSFAGSGGTIQPFSRALARWRSDSQLHSPELTLRDQSERFILWFRLDRLLPPLSAFEGGTLVSVQPRR